jgi:hypothetical protein
MKKKVHHPQWFVNNLGAFFATQKTGLCGAPRYRAPAPPAMEMILW